MKKRLFSKLLSVLLTCALIVTTFGAAVFADENDVEEEAVPAEADLVVTDEEEEEPSIIESEDETTGDESDDDAVVEDVTEDEIIKDLENVYFQLDNIRQKLYRSTDVELRKKFMEPVFNLMNILDYEI